MYNKAFPNGFSLSLYPGVPTCPINYVAEYKGVTNVATYNPIEAEVIHEREYTDAYGRQAFLLKSKQKNVIVGWGGRNVFSNGRTITYTYETLYKDLPTAILLSAFREGEFLVYPGGSCLDGVDLENL